MHAYKCICRLDGELGQTVPKTNVSASHIIMMKMEHGDDGVVDIEKTADILKWPVKKNGRTINEPVLNSDMREFLEKEFGAEKVGKVFGAFYGATLPDSLPGFEKASRKKPTKTATKTKVSATVEEEPTSDEETTDEVEGKNEEIL